MTDFSPASYQRQLDAKLNHLEDLFRDHHLPAPEIFTSPPVHYRMRAEFRIWHQGPESFYAMTPEGGKVPEPIADFPQGSRAMAEVMPRLLAAINGNQELRRKLYATEFLTTQDGQVLATLIYHKPLAAAWETQARQVAETLGIGIIGRSKKQKLTLGDDFVIETLAVGGANYRYQQVETGFTQPNAAVNEKMLSWARAVSRDNGGDLLELYCGNGNFTVVLSENFRRVLATEVAKISVRSAQYNLALNGVANVAIARMSSEEFTQALNRERAFNRLKDIDLDSYDFSTIFVDPPRAGLDPATLALASRFEWILYISCNPTTLKDNLAVLTDTHRVEHFAVFDQFPYTRHLECGALLRRR